MKGGNMKKIGFLFCFLGLLVFASAAQAIGLEVAVGGWYHSPTGNLSYKLAAVNDKLDIEDDLDYDGKLRFTGRAKVKDLPFFLPSIYVMATPMEFDGTGRKNVSFKFGDQNFLAATNFTSNVRLTHYDVALYYGIPFLETATAGLLAIDIGLDIRFVDFSADVTQGATSQTESIFLPVPMVFFAARIMPHDRVWLEGEFRGIAYSGSSYYSLIGRVRVNVYGPVFATTGYRWDYIDINQDNFKALVNVGGFFFELGFEI